MTNYQPSDVLFMQFPFAEPVRAKARPVLVLLDTGDDDVLVARITTHRPMSMFDVTLSDWQQSGLLAPSVARLHKMATMEKSLVRRRLGRLTPSDRQHVAAVLPQLIAVWQAP